MSRASYRVNGGGEDVRGEGDPPSMRGRRRRPSMPGSPSESSRGRAREEVGRDMG